MYKCKNTKYKYMNIYILYIEIYLRTVCVGMFSYAHSYFKTSSLDLIPRQNTRLVA